MIMEYYSHVCDCHRFCILLNIFHETQRINLGHDFNDVSGLGISKCEMFEVCLSNSLMF
jgi:hypothetical protein